MFRFSNLFLSCWFVLDEPLVVIMSGLPDYLEMPQLFAEAEFLAGIGYWVFDPSTGEERWSSGLEAILNVSASHSSPNLFDFLPSLEGEIDRFLGSKLPFCRRKFVYRTFADTLNLLFQAEKRYDSDGNVVCILATIQNVTDIAWTFGMAGLGEQLLQAVISCDDVLVAATNTDLIVTYTEGNGWKNLGLSIDEVVGMDLTKFSDKHQKLRYFFRETLKGRPQSGYHSIRGRHYTARTQPLFGTEGNIVGVIAFAIDITDRKVIIDNLQRGRELLEEAVRQRSEELQASEAALRSVLQSANAGIVFADTQGVITYANAAYHRILGYEEGEIVGRCIDELMVQGIPETELERKNRTALFQGEITQFRQRLLDVKKNGEHLWIDACVSASRDADGNIVSLVAVVAEILEQNES